MKILMIGAAGMVGRKIVNRLASEPLIFGTPVERLTLVDVISPSAPEQLCDITVADTLDLSQQGATSKLIADRPDLIIHLAAVVSGEAEVNFDLGYAVNLDGTRALFDAIRHEGDDYTPRVVFASSAAVFGAPLPNVIADDFFTTPLTSYGAQKAICELLLADYSRKGFFDGIGLRLPTICVRPGKPNKAASGFFSNIIREPLVGIEAVLPVKDTLKHWHASPRSAVGFFIHAATMDLSGVGPRRNLMMPGVSVTVAEQIEALKRVAGNDAAKLIRTEIDPAIEEIVGFWAQEFEAKRAQELGFVAETNFDEIIRVHIEDELNGKIGAH